MVVHISHSSATSEARVDDETTHGVSAGAQVSAASKGKTQPKPATPSIEVRENSDCFYEAASLGGPHRSEGHSWSTPVASPRGHFAFEERTLASTESPTRKLTEGHGAIAQAIPQALYGGSRTKWNAQVTAVISEALRCYPAGTSLDSLLALFGRKRGDIARENQTFRADVFGLLRGVDDPLYTPIGSTTNYARWHNFLVQKCISSKSEVSHWGFVSGHGEGMCAGKRTSLTGFLLRSGERFRQLFHTSPEEFPRIWVECRDVWQRCLMPQQNLSELTSNLADLHWWLSQATFFQRGSAAIAEWVIRYVCELHGYLPPRFDLMPDCLALCTPNLTDHRKSYRENMLALPVFVEPSAMTVDDYSAQHLCRASRLGDIAACRYLIAERGCSADAADTAGYTPLLLASMGGFEQVVVLLLESGASVDMLQSESLVSPLLLASRRGHAAVVRVLLGAGANPCHKDILGESVLEAALLSRDDDGVDLLLALAEVRDSVRVGVKAMSRGILHSAGRFATSYALDALLAVTGPEYMLHCDENEETPLTCAMRALNWGSVRGCLAIASRGEVAIGGDDARLILLTAISNDAPEDVVASILESAHGLDVNEAGDYKTLLSDDVYESRDAGLVLRNRERHKRRTEKDVTPLILAAERGLVQIVKLLIQVGADPNLAPYTSLVYRGDPQPLAPLQVAAKCAQWPVMGALLDGGARFLSAEESDKTMELAMGSLGKLLAESLGAYSAARVLADLNLPHQSPTMGYGDVLDAWKPCLKLIARTDIVDAVAWGSLQAGFSVFGRLLRSPEY